MQKYFWKIAKILQKPWFVLGIWILGMSILHFWGCFLLKIVKNEGREGKRAFLYDDQLVWAERKIIAFRRKTKQNIVYGGSRNIICVCKRTMMFSLHLKWCCSSSEWCCVLQTQMKKSNPWELDFLELLPRFELGTSSLPRMCSTNWAISAMATWRGLEPWTDRLWAGSSNQLS